MEGLPSEGNATLLAYPTHNLVEASLTPASVAPPSSGLEYLGRQTAEVTKQYLYLLQENSQRNRQVV